MDSIFFYDGRLFKQGEPALPFDDRSVFFGDAVYDACLIKNGIPYLLRRHIARLYDGLKQLSIPAPMCEDALFELLLDLCRRADCEIAFLYFQVSRYADTRRHYFKDSDEGKLMVTVCEFPKPSKDTVLRLILEKDRRYEYCNIKTTNLLPAVLASARARKHGADEAVFIRNAIVTECAHSNVSILKNGMLFTHPTDRHILPGIARERLIDTCLALKIPVSEQPFGVKALLEADEILITSTSKICLRAGAVGGRAVGMRDETRARRIIDALFADFWHSHIA